jgi:hypothetical protein
VGTAPGSLGKRGLSGTNGGIFKSTDGGASWKPLKQGLPDGLMNAELSIAPANPRRLYATIDAGDEGTGIYRSDDGGETWARSTTDRRPTSRVNEAVPHVHPKEPDILIVTDIVSYKSTDGGRTFVPFKGAPGGDDNQNLWWNPDDPNIMLMVIDQGAVVTLNGGETWISWFTQPTAALYHVMADNAFPYRVCGGQQESGSVCVASRGNNGQITFREWHPVGVEEYGYAAPDPLDPDLVYGGKVTRYDRRTGQVSDVGPVRAGRGGLAPVTAAPRARQAAAYRTVRTQPVVFSTVDLHALFYGNNVLWKTVNGGITWKQISPDLTREKWDVPKSVGKYAGRVQTRERGAVGAQVIYSIGPSHRDINRIWIGTDDGLIYTTADGGVTWKNVTPPQVTAFMKVFTIDPGRRKARSFGGDAATSCWRTQPFGKLRARPFRKLRARGSWWPRIRAERHVDWRERAARRRDEPVAGSRCSTDDRAIERHRERARGGSTGDGTMARDQDGRSRCAEREAESGWPDGDYTVTTLPLLPYLAG